jgi:hypothetical protein
VENTVEPEQFKLGR